MNILHISSAQSWRGGERQIFYLINGLENNGHDNFLMSPSGSSLRQKCGLKSSNTKPFKKGVLSIVSNINTLKKCCVENKIDLIHGHDSHAHTLLWMAYRFGGLTTKSVVTRRLINPVKNRSVGKYNYKKIEKIICISEAVKDALKPSISEPSRLEVIYSSILDATTVEKNKNNRDRKEFVVGYVAAFTKEKDHKTFIKTAKYLLNHYEDKNFRFLLVGDGLLLDEIKAESIDIANHIKFTGFLEDVDTVYKEMDLLLHTSNSEALGTAILDAMKFGLPIVATNVGGIPEIVIHGKNGFLAEAGDYQKMGEYVHNLASDDNLYDELSKNSDIQMSKFDVATMVQKTIKLYIGLLK